MKNLFLFVVACATVVPLLTLETDHFTAECDNKLKATITPKGTFKLQKSSSSSSSCTGTLASNKLTSSNNCAAGVEFYVADSTSKTILQSYKVKCVPINDGVDMVRVEITPKENPDTQTAGFHPKTLELKLLGTKPIDTKPIGDTVTDARLGTTLYLTIYRSTGKKDKIHLIPLSCYAAIGTGTGSTNNDNITLLETGATCKKQKEIITGEFEFGYVISDGEYAAIEMKAFEFSSNQNDKIIFSCKVRICTDVTSVLGDCKTDNDHMNACPGTWQPISSSGRRRRDVDADGFQHGSVHHLTATLRVTDDLLGSSSSAGQMTVSLFTVAVAAMFVL